MKQTRLIMGMPITIEIAEAAQAADIKEVFAYFKDVDSRFSPYKKNSEVTRLNQGLAPSEWSESLKLIVELCAQTKRQTDGYFNAYRRGHFDPSGLVKGWSINEAAELLKSKGYRSFYIEAGGDIALSGHSSLDQAWRVGIRNPFNTAEVIKIVALDEGAIATSGTYIRGPHIYNPKDGFKPANEVKSLSVIGPNIYDADRYATAAFAMGAKGLGFIAALPGFEAYQVNPDQTATLTAGFERYVVNA